MEWGLLEVAAISEQLQVIVDRLKMTAVSGRQLHNQEMSGLLSFPNMKSTELQKVSVQWMLGECGAGPRPAGTQQGRMMLVTWGMRVTVVITLKQGHK